MLKKLNKRKLIFFLVMTILLAAMGPVKAFGENNITIVIRKTDENNIVEGFAFDFWYISQEKLSDRKRIDLVKEFDSLTKEELNEKFPEYFKSASTNEEGEVKVDGLKDGAYYIRQNLDSDIEFDEVSSPFIVNIPSEDPKIYPKGGSRTRIQIRKVDEEGNPLRDAKFEVYRLEESGESKLGFTEGKYDPKSTDYALTVNGTLSLGNLPEGDYYLQEIEAPEGYVLDETKHYFSVVNGRTTEIEVLNKRIEVTGGHKFYKYDRKKETPLADARFKLTKYDEDSKKYFDVLKDGETYIVESGKDGQFIVEDLEYGNYQLVEVKSPSGYKIDSTPISFVVDENSITEKISIPNDEITITPGEPKPPTPGTIPKTGDVSLILAVIGGSVMAGMGWYLVKKEEE